MRYLAVSIIGLSGLVFLNLPMRAGAPTVTTDGKSFTVSVENGSYGQILELIRQKTGLEYDVPPELTGQRLPLVEIRDLPLKAALVKLLEGSNYDYILISSSDDPTKVSRLMVTGRSVRSSNTGTLGSPMNAAALPRRINRQIAEDPFGGGGDSGSDEGSGPEPITVAPSPDAPPTQGSGQPMTQPGGVAPAQAPQAQPLQPVSPYAAQPFGQPLPPMTPQQTIPGMGQQPPQPNNSNTRRSPF